MNSPDTRREQLEKLIDHALKGQPVRRAPTTLGDRVWAEIGRRTALPWRHRGFAHWPAGARIAFVLALLAFVWLLLAFTGPAADDAETAVRSGIGNLAGDWPATLRTLVSAVQELAGLVTRALPTAWVYGIAAVVAALYVTCFGLGAATYRLLHART
jgi:hypothetical protein